MNRLNSFRVFCVALLCIFIGIIVSHFIGPDMVSTVLFFSGWIVAMSQMWHINRMNRIEVETNYCKYCDLDLNSGMCGPCLDSLTWRRIFFFQKEKK